MQNSMVNSTIFDWRFKSKRKSQRKRNKRHIWKRKFVLITENLTILQEKIHSNRIQMTSTNEELNAEFNEIPLKIQIDAKISEENKQKRHLQEKNLQELQKISQFRNRKFTQSDFKWHREMQNIMVDSTIFDWKFKSKRKSQKKTNKQHIWKRKFGFITKNFTIS